MNMLVSSAAVIAATVPVAAAAATPPLPSAASTTPWAVATAASLDEHLLNLGNELNKTIENEKAVLASVVDIDGREADRLYGTAADASSAIVAQIIEIKATTLEGF